MTTKEKWFAVGILIGFLLSVYAAMESRAEARQLLAQLHQLRDDNRRLEDESRSLELEYHTFADYAKIRERALELGMVDPALRHGNLFYMKSEAAKR